MASRITKRNKVRWRGCVKIDGKQTQKIFNTKKEAVNWERDFRKEMEAQSAQKTPLVFLTIFEWTRAALAESKQRNSKQTFEEKLRVFNRVLDYFGPETLVADITAEQVLKYLRKQKDERSANGANVDRKDLVWAWNWATDFQDGFPDKVNPFEKVQKFNHTTEERYTPPIEDFWAVYNAVDGQDKVMLLTFLNLAARRKEVFNLKWADIDFTARAVRLFTKKRKSGQREADWLPMSDELYEALRKWKQDRVNICSHYVFTVTADERFDNQYTGEPFKQRRYFMASACERAKVPPFGFHSIRHLAATRLYHEGVKIAVIQKLLRHKSVATTEKYLRSCGLDVVREALVHLKRNPVGPVVDFPKAV